MDTGNNQTGSEPLAKNDEYLWDGSGDPDPEIQKLEKLLGRFRHECPAPVFPKIVPDRRWQFLRWRMRRFPALVTAAAVVAIAVVTFLAYVRKPAVTVVGWDVSRLAGAPRIGRNTISGKETSRLRIGQILETDQQ